MFTKKFDRRFRAIVLVKMCVLPIALPYGLWALWPANVEKGYQPEQPIAFSHKLHAGELNINCVYCHSNVNDSPHATVPAVSTCMKCHSQVQPTIEIIEAVSSHGEDHGDHDHSDGAHHEADVDQKFMDTDHTFGLGKNFVKKEILNPEIAKLLKYFKEKEPIKWVKVHDLADFVYFDHSRHIAVGQQCVDCHGDVKNMEVMKREHSLKMKWCLDCHRKPNRTGEDGQYKATSPEYAARGIRGPENCFACHR